jgi:hypothetical protein
MARTVDQGVLDFFKLVLQVIWAVDGEGAEAEVEGDAAFLRLRVLIKGGSAGDGAQTLSQRCFTAAHKQLSRIIFFAEVLKSILQS